MYIYTQKLNTSLLLRPYVPKITITIPMHNYIVDVPEWRWPLNFAAPVSWNLIPPPCVTTVTQEKLSRSFHRKSPNLHFDWKHLIGKKRYRSQSTDFKRKRCYLTFKSKCSVFIYLFLFIDFFTFSSWSLESAETDSKLKVSSSEGHLV